MDAPDVLAVLDLLAAAGDQALPGGGSFHYPPPVGGTVGGRPVRCVDAHTQVRAHLGYPPSAKDHTDMRLLRERLRVGLVPPYA